VLHPTYFPQPFVPDYWESSSVQPKDSPPAGPSIPKILVVAGSSTHGAWGPTHHLEPAESYGVEPRPMPSTPTGGLRGLWADIADDLDIPRNITLGAAQHSLAEQLPLRTAGHSRDLDRDEKRGLWVFLGLLGGSWLLGGALATGSAFAEDAPAKQTSEAHKA